MRLHLVTLAILALTLTACNDPMGWTTRTKIRSDTTIELAQIEAATTRATLPARIGGSIVLFGIAGLTVIGVSLIAGGTHIIVQRDRLGYRPETWVASLPTQPTGRAVTDGRRPGARPMPLLQFTQRRRAPSATLALPERSETTRTNGVIVIDA